MASSGYRRLLTALSLLPASPAKIAAEMDIDEAVIARWLRMFEWRRVVHVSSIEHTGRCKYERIYSIGNCESVPSPHDSRFVVRRMSEYISNLSSFINAMDIPRTSNELSEETGVNLRQTNYLVRLMQELGIAHISGWADAGCSYAAEWVFGRGVDVKRPKKLSKKQTNARHWEKRRARIEQERILRALTGAHAANQADMDQAA